jgi:hypothetical protein
MGMAVCAACEGPGQPLGEPQDIRRMFSDVSNLLLLATPQR